MTFANHMHFSFTLKKEFYFSHFSCHPLMTSIYIYIYICITDGKEDERETTETMDRRCRRGYEEDGSERLEKNCEG
jgi:hypothetical protein